MPSNAAPLPNPSVYRRSRRSDTGTSCCGGAHSTVPDRSGSHRTVDMPVLVVCRLHVLQECWQAIAKRAASLACCLYGPAESSLLTYCAILPRNFVVGRGKPRSLTHLQPSPAIA